MMRNFTDLMTLLAGLMIFATCLMLWFRYVEPLLP